MKSKAIFLLTFAFITETSFLSAQQTNFNNNISPEEKSILNSGKVLIRNVDKLNQLGMDSTNPGVQKAIQTAKDLHPAYIAEIIQVRPYKGNENLRERLSKMIVDIPSYAGIPYYSERAEDWYDLYSSAKITSQTTTDNKTTILADLEMEPFGIINTQIDIESTTSYFYYESMNLNKLRYYDKFTCVTPNHMKSIITAYRDGDNWILYGIGVVNAPSIFFLRNRVETSFMNRKIGR